MSLEITLTRCQEAYRGLYRSGVLSRNLKSELMEVTWEFSGQEPACCGVNLLKHLRPCSLGLE